MTPCNSRGATGALSAFEEEIRDLETLPQVGYYTTSVALGRKFLRNHTVVECHVSRWCGWYKFVTNGAVEEFSGRYTSLKSSPERSS